MSSSSLPSSLSSSSSPSCRTSKQIKHVFGRMAFPFVCFWFAAIILFAIKSYEMVVLCNPLMPSKEPSEPASLLSLSESSGANDEWKDVLKKMTEQNPCGSSENYTLCVQCGQWTGNQDAFYMCCLNVDGVREYCISFINYDLDEQKIKPTRR